MDTIAALNFGIVISLAIKSRGVSDEKLGIEVRISYAGRRLRTEKREINQWSGASVEMRVDSKK